MGNIKIKMGKICSKYIELGFLDSLRFMSSSLDNLAKHLTAHPYLDKTFKDNELLREKGIFPYEYLNSYDVLDEERLPDRDKFYSSLKLESVNEKEHVHACRVFIIIKVKRYEIF